MASSHSTSTPVSAAAHHPTSPARPPPPPSILPPSSDALAPLQRLPSLKRSRPDSLAPAATTTTSSHPFTQVGRRLSPSPKSQRPNSHYPSAYMPMQLTGAAALAEEQRRRIDDATTHTSDNPGHRVAALLAGDSSVATSRAHPPLLHVGTTSALSSGGLAMAPNNSMAPLLSPISQGREETSPTSVTSLHSLGHAHSASTATAHSAGGLATSPQLHPMPRDDRGHVPEAGRAYADDAQPQHGGGPQSTSSYPSPYHPSYPDPSDLSRRDGPLPPTSQHDQLPPHALQPKSPSTTTTTTKKHRCPYCDTEFTRHHNLKSHLLTHSQEKPYECQQCRSKFRRLHDLKRHTKLHTGERPHTCQICKRKFARGDALARHTKGQGGCAGRRGSQGVDAGGEDDFEASQMGDTGDGMDGILYTDHGGGGSMSHSHHHHSHSQSMAMADEEAAEAEAQARRMSLPSIKAQHVHDHPSGGGVGGGGAGGSMTDNSYGPHLSRTPSTYPPAGPRPTLSSPGGLYPPPTPGATNTSSTSGGASPGVAHTHTTHTTSPVPLMNIPLSSLSSAGADAILPPGGMMTESPKPLSPSGQQGPQLGHDNGNGSIANNLNLNGSLNVTRQRSPSLSTHLQQTHFHRRGGGSQSGTGRAMTATPPVLPNPSPRVAQGPKLPSLSGLAHAVGEVRFGGTMGMHGHSPMRETHPSDSLSSSSSGNGPPTTSGPASSSSNFFLAKPSEREMLSHISQLEEQLKSLSEKIVVMEARERIMAAKVQEEKMQRLEAENAQLRGELERGSRVL